MFAAAWAVAVLLCGASLIGLYIYKELRTAFTRPGWRRLPSRPGLPPDMEFQCWTTIEGFDPFELSDAVVLATDLLSPVLGRRSIFAALTGSRLLIYEASTYPGDECTPVVLASAAGTTRSAAVERKLMGLAHALVHLVERHTAGSSDVTHADWDTRGITIAVRRYEYRRQYGT